MGRFMYLRRAHCSGACIWLASYALLLVGVLILKILNSEDKNEVKIGLLGQAYDQTSTSSILSLIKTALTTLESTYTLPW